MKTKLGRRAGTYAISNWRVGTIVIGSMANVVWVMGSGTQTS